MSPYLSKEERVCCCCGAKVLAKRGVRTNQPGSIEPSILAITPILYRRGAGKGVLRSCPRIQVCEGCFQRFITLTDSRSMQTTIALRLIFALRESVSGRYSNLLEEDSASALPPLPSPDSAELFGGLN